MKSKKKAKKKVRLKVKAGTKQVLFELAEAAEDAKYAKPPVEQFIPLAHRMAIRFLRQRPQYAYQAEDVHQEALLGLCVAARCFDPSRRVTFMTYAWVSIHRRLTAWADRDGHVNRLPAYAAERGVTRNTVISIHRAIDDSGDDLAPWLVDPRSASDAEAFESAEEAERLMEGLEPRQRWVLHERYVQGVRLKDVGREVGLSGERIRQIELRAIRNVREQFPGRVVDQGDGEEG